MSDLTLRLEVSAGEVKPEFYDNNYFGGKNTYAGSNVEDILREFEDF